MKVTADLHCIGSLGNVSLHGADVVLAVVGHYVVGSNEGGHVATCLFRQIVVDFPVIGFPSRAADGFVDGARTAVVGGNHQVPVFVNVIHVLQVACCRPGRLYRVTAFVYEAVAFQSVYLSGGEHKLP